MLSGMPSSPTRSVLVRLTALTAVLLLAVSLVAVGAGAATPRAKSGAVTIKDFAFSPKTLKIKAGTKIKVSNKDGTTHTFTANKGAFDTGDIDGGSSATVTVKKPGTYAYHCNIHANMKGTVKAT
jgi:plastocyanin